MKKIVVAIDGYAACGKSTLARQLADKLHYLFLDTGAMYRAVTLYFLRNNIDWKNEEILPPFFSHVKIDFQYDVQDGKYITLLNDENVEEEIRSLAVSNYVSEIAAASSVRKFLVHQQQEIGKQKGIVMDGRDIGTVVFPDAEVKIFVMARMEVRIKRRWQELQENGITVSEEEIKKNLEKRDREETTRTDSPLRKADDAIVLDNSDMTQEEQLEWGMELISQLAN